VLRHSLAAGLVGAILHPVLLAGIVPILGWGVDASGCEELSCIPVSLALLVLALAAALTIVWFVLRLIGLAAPARVVGLAVPVFVLASWVIGAVLRGQAPAVRNVFVSVLFGLSIAGCTAVLEATGTARQPPARLRQRRRSERDRPPIQWPD